MAVSVPWRRTDCGSVTRDLCEANAHCEPASHGGVGEEGVPGDNAGALSSQRENNGNAHWQNARSAPAWLVVVCSCAQLQEMKMTVRRWLQERVGRPIRIGASQDVAITDLHVCPQYGLAATASFDVLGCHYLVSVELTSQRDDVGRFACAIWVIKIFESRDIGDDVDAVDRSEGWIVCGCGSHIVDDYPFGGYSVMTRNVDEWYRSQPAEWVANFRGEVRGMPGEWGEITLWNRALECALRDKFKEFITDEAACNEAAEIIGSLYPNVAVYGFDLRTRVPVENIYPQLPQWRDWLSEQDGQSLRELTVWSFAIEVWKPILPGTGIKFADLSEYDVKGAHAFNSFLRARLHRPGDIIAAWERGGEYLFGNKITVVGMEKRKVLELAPNELIPTPPVPRSKQRMGIYKKKPAR